MKNEVFKNFPWTDLTAVGFFIFMTLFVVFVYITLKKTNKEYFEDASKIPFEEDEQVKSNNFMKKGFSHE